MPRQDRRVPLGMDRWNYWYFDIAAAHITTRPGPVSVAYARNVSAVSHFYAILSDPKMALYYARLFDGPFDDPEFPTPELDSPAFAALAQWRNDVRVLALVHYIYGDSLWSQNGEAWTLLRGLPAPAQNALRAFDRQCWPRHRNWTWQTLIPPRCHVASAVAGR